jgi:nuclear GTP-binding protein
MVLNDWLRGRIPFYVPPPESVEPLTEEQKLEKKSKIGVEQIFGKINVTSEYMEEDLVHNAQLIAEEKARVKAKKAEEAAHRIYLESAKKEEVKKKEEKIMKDEVTDWDEVYEDVVGEEGPVVKAPVIEGEEEEEDEQEVAEEEEAEEEVEEDEQVSKKAKINNNETEVDRKKKKVGVHYYDTVNVKNKNRNRVKPDENKKKVLNSRLKGSSIAGSKRKRN